MPLIQRLLLLATLIIITPYYGSLFARGLRQRRVFFNPQLDVERDRNPVLYWILQVSYAAATVIFAVSVPLIATGYRFGKSSLDGLVAILSSTFLLLSAIAILTVIAVCLRTGVAPGKLKLFKRGEQPLQYWSLISLLALFGSIMATLGAVLIWANLK